jgi:hypothetical protein
MCIPVAAAAIAAGAISAAGTVMQGYSAMQQGNYEAGVHRINAKLEREAAEQSLKAGESERKDFWRKVGQVKGQQAASMAANGIDLGFGTAARIQDDTQRLANEDATNLYENIHQRTRGYIINNWNERMAAKSAKQQGKAAFAGSLFQGASSLLGGFTQASQLKTRMGG